MLYANVGGIRDPVKQEIILEFCRNQNKDICISSETHINHEQIHQITNNCQDPFFSLLEIPFQKVYLSYLIQALLMLLRLTQIQKGDLCPSNLLLLVTEFFVFILLQDSSREQLARGHFFEEFQNYMENKFQGNENKIKKGDFNCTLDKMDRDEGNKK